MYGWIEAAIRYAGAFGSQEKIVYQQIFDVSEPTTSRHQAEFAGQFEAACEAPVFKREADGRLSKGRLTLLEEVALPETPVFEKMPALERWLQDALGTRYVEVDIRRSTPRQDIVRSVLQSIWSRVPLRILYHSRSGTRERAISPHAIVKAVGRLHVRAYDHLKNQHRDFVLSRIEMAIPTVHDGQYVDADQDKSWRRVRTVVIEARGSGADEAIRRGVALDFDLPASGRRELKVPEPFVQYLIDDVEEGYRSPVRIHDKSDL